MKKIKTLFISIVAIIMLLCVNGCIQEGTKGPEGFEELTSNIFKTLIGNDELTSNFLFNNPEAFGLEHYEPTLPTPGVTNAVGKIVINLYFGSIKAYNYNLLNEDQQYTYDIIVDLLNYINAQTSEMSYLSNNYLGSYLGYQAQLPLLLVEYNFRTKLDVENYIKLLALVPETFKSYVDFEIEKAEKGYGMNNIVIDKVISQCDKFVEGINNNPDDHFLIRVINQKIDSLSFLNDEEKTFYKKVNKESVQGPVISGYQYVSDHLGEVRDKGTNTQGLYYYVKEDETTIGKDYYQLLFQKSTGYTVTIDEAISYIDNIIAQNDDKLTYFKELAKTNEVFKNEISDIQLMNQTPEQQIALYNQLINGHFPALTSTPNININYIDSSMEDNFSPAAYMVSPVDEYLDEYIYLNNKSITTVVDEKEVLDYNYLYTVLAHEGIPGHLYQNNYFKNIETNIVRKVLKNSGYVEGWATYAEMYSYKFLEGYLPETVDYLIFNDELTYALYSRMDMGIHYEGWTKEQVTTFLHQYFNTSEEAINNVYNQLVEVPVNCQYYAFTYFKFKDMYNTVKNTLGDSFDPVSFHKVILDCGPIAVEDVEHKVYQTFIPTES